MQTLIASRYKLDDKMGKQVTHVGNRILGFLTNRIAVPSTDIADGFGRGSRTLLIGCHLPTLPAVSDQFQPDRLSVSITQPWMSPISDTKV